MISNLAEESLPGNGQMSELGQIRKSGRATRQSALPSRTDIISRAYQVRKVPILLQKSAATDGSVGHFAKGRPALIRRL
jgi:hypothetical protein